MILDNCMCYCFVLLFCYDVCNVLLYVYECFILFVPVFVFASFSVSIYNIYIYIYIMTFRNVSDALDKTSICPGGGGGTVANGP